MGPAQIGGEFLGKYRLIEKLGSGGMGTVYRAEDTHLKRMVALKILKDTSLSDSASVDRFRHEARAASSLNHPNICTVYDAGDADGVPYLVMELLLGQTLADQIATHPLPLATLLQLGIQISGALATAHESGIVHRDLKPANIFLTGDGTPKLLDFGVSKRIDGAVPTSEASTVSAMMTADGNILGTVPYMSPEQAQGKPVDARSDLFSFGAVLYEMAAARRAFPGDSTATIFAEILRGEPRPIRLINPEIPEELQRIIAKAVEKDPADRYQSAREMAVDMRRLARQSSGSVAAATPAAALPAAVIDRRSKLLLWIGLFAAVLLATVLIAVLIPSGSTGPLDSQQITFSSEPKQGPLFTDGARLYFESREVPVQMPASGGDSAPMQILPPSMSLLDISTDASKVLALQPTLDDNEGRGTLWEIPALGGPPRALGNLVAQTATWSPDGKSLVFANLRAIYSADADGGNEKKIWDAPGYVSTLSFSPDAKQILATVTIKAAQRLWALQSDGQRPHPLLQDWPSTASQWSGEWTPDGLHFVFLSDREGRSNVYELIAPRWYEFWKKPAARRLTGNQLSIDSETPSADGKSLFVLGRLEQGSMQALDPATGRFSSFLGLSALMFSVSPDRQWIAYIEYPSNHLWKCRLDGSEKVELTQTFAMMQQWSPDSKAIAYSDWNKIYLISADGGVPQKLLEKGTDEVAPSWSPSGTSIYFNYFPHADQPFTGIHIVDLATRAVSDMSGAKDFFVPSWSPDGKYLVAVTQNPARMMLYTAATGQWSELHRFDAPWGYWAWAPDSKSLYTGQVQGKNGIYRLTVPGGAWQKLSDLDGLTLPPDPTANSWMSVTPDGQPALMSDTSVTQIYSLRWKQ